MNNGISGAFHTLLPDIVAIGLWGSSGSATYYAKFIAYHADVDDGLALEVLYTLAVHSSLQLSKLVPHAIEQIEKWKESRGQ
jgi:hypothetical protein